MTGPYYHDDRVTIHHGDCRAVLAAMPAESVHAVVCDPPYDLTNRTPDVKGCVDCGRTLGGNDGTPDVCPRCGGELSYQRSQQKKGFMGAAWDATGVAFDPGTWAEVLRVLKPGGHLIAFGGTRTAHRMVCAIEDAGFEIRESISMLWAYGCLTADTEILTEYGWKLGVDVAVGERIAQWDPADESVTLAEVQETFRGPWDGPIVKFKNRDTDQLVTPNHRVVFRTARHVSDRAARVWPDEWRVAEAADVPRGSPLRLPLGGVHDGPGIGGEDYAALLGWVWTEGGFDSGPNNRGSGVRIYQSTANPISVKGIDALLDRMEVPHKRYQRDRVYRYKGNERTYTEVCWFISGEWARRIRTDLPGKHPTWALLWAMTFDEKLALWEAAMDGDGHRGAGREAFYQKSEPDLVWFQTLTSLIGKSGGAPRTRERGSGTSGQVGVRQRNTTELQTRTLRDRSEHYVGDVWCVRVPTGAFLARRHGQIFASGNSGFPKSQNVGKAIDKAAGVEREVVGSKLGLPGYSMTDGNGDHRTYSPGLSGNTGTGGAECAVTAPATVEAAQWDGWGSALKPAVEPIVLARKPLDGTIAQNVLTHGAGALNIDGCRIPTGGEQNIGPGSLVDPSNRTGTVGANMGISRSDLDRFQQAQAASVERTNALGRFPANLVLVHNPGCRPAGSAKVKSRAVAVNRNRVTGQSRGMDVPIVPPVHTLEDAGYRDADGNETIDVWVCTPGCPVKALDEQSGVSSSPLGMVKGQSRKSGVMGVPDGHHETMSGHGDTGGASRFFARFGWELPGDPDGIENPVRYMAKAAAKERPSYMKQPDPKLRLRADLTDEQVAHVRERLQQAGVDVD